MWKKRAFKKQSPKSEPECKGETNLGTVAEAPLTRNWLKKGIYSVGQAGRHEKPNSIFELKASLNATLGTIRKGKDN